LWRWWFHRLYPVGLATTEEVVASVGAEVKTTSWAVESGKLMASVNVGCLKSNRLRVASVALNVATPVPSVTPCTVVTLALEEPPTPLSPWTKTVFPLTGLPLRSRRVTTM